MQENIDFLKLCFPGLIRVPVTYSIVLTRRCNSRCSICELWKDDTKDLPFRVIKQFVSEALKLNPKAIFSLTGGEPTLRSDIIEIVDFIHSRGGRIVITTNSNIPPMVRKKLLSRDLRLSLTLMSMEEKLHDKIRGKGNLKRTLRLAKEADTYINCVIFRDNVKDIPGVVEYCNSKGLPLYLTLIDKFWEGDKTQRDLFPDSPDMNRLLSQLRIYKDKGFLKHFYRSDINNLENVYLGKPIKCEAYRRNLKINCAGRLYVCMKLPPYGTFPAVSLDSIPDNFQSMEKLAKGCKGCTLACIRTFSYIDFLDRLKDFFKDFVRQNKESVRQTKNL